MDSVRRAKFQRTNTAQIDPRWLDAMRTADYISVSLDALYHMVQRRQIPFVLKGRRLFFDRLALDRWMLKDALDGLKRRGSKGIFWTDFKVAKRRIRVSTGFTDLKLARQREAELKKEARFARLGWRKPAPAFSEWTKTYESAFTVQKARGTQRRDREILARAREFFGTTPIDQIARSDCETYVNWRRKSGNANPTYKAGIRPLADGTVTREVSFLQALFQAALDDGLLEANPWRKVKRERYKSRERVITPEEQASIEAKLPPRFLRFFHFLLGTGARLDEARTVEPSDIDWKRGTIHVVGKFGKERDIPLAPEVVDVLREQVSAEGRLWHQNPQRLREVLARAAKRAEVGLIGPHVCRHTFATRYLQRGGDIYTLSRILGHASVSVTERHYAHMVNTDIVALSRHILSGIVRGGTVGIRPAAKRR